MGRSRSSLRRNPKRYPRTSSQIQPLKSMKSQFTEDQPPLEFSSDESINIGKSSSDGSLGSSVFEKMVEYIYHEDEDDLNVLRRLLYTGVCSVCPSSINGECGALVTKEEMKEMDGNFCADKNQSVTDDEISLPIEEKIMKNQKKNQKVNRHRSTNEVPLPIEENIMKNQKKNEKVSKYRSTKEGRRKQKGVSKRRHKEWETMENLLRKENEIDNIIDENFDAMLNKSDDIASVGPAEETATSQQNNVASEEGYTQDFEVGYNSQEFEVRYNTQELEMEFHEMDSPEMESPDSSKLERKQGFSKISLPKFMKKKR